MQRPSDAPQQGPPTSSARTPPSRKRAPRPEVPPAEPPGEPLAPPSGPNKPNVAAAPDGGGLVAVPFSPQAAQASRATVKTAPLVRLSKGPDELFEGGWTQCVMYILGLLCMLVAVASIVIVYLFLQKAHLAETRTPAFQRYDTQDYASLPVTGGPSKSTSNASFDDVERNVTLVDQSLSEEQGLTP